MKNCIKNLILAPALMCALGLMPAGRVMAQAFTSLHNFTALDTLNGYTNSEGAQPYDRLILSGSTLYGTTSVGGVDGGGTVFAVKTDGTGFTNVYTFTFDASFNFANGVGPEGGLIVAGNTLYGTTEGGGISGRGTVFAVNTDGTGFKNLHSFIGSDGNNVRGSLVLSGNTLYGTTETGGTNFGSQGTIFTVNTDGTGFRSLYSFTATSGNGETNSDGSEPNRDLVLSGGTLYGTTAYGGTNGYGTIFAVNTNGMGFTILHCFTLIDQTYSTNSDGARPEGGLILSGSTLYGTTLSGGMNGHGTIFAVNTDGTGFTILHSFSPGEGQTPYGVLVLSSNTLYGTTIDGGASFHGTVFAVNTDGAGFATLYNFTATAGTLGSYGTNGDGVYPWDGLVLSDNVLYGTAHDGGAQGAGTVFALNLSAAPPPIQFTASPTNGTAPLTVQFNSPSVDANGNAITNWNWNFGDSSTSTSQNPSHTYTTAGSFSLTLVVTNIYGGVASGSGPAITVSPAPTTVQYTASPTNGTAPLAVQFNSSSIDSGGNTINSWNWNFGDGNTSTAQNPSHTYTTSGSYFPALVATNNLGGTVSGSGPAVSVTPAPPGGPGLVAYYSFDDGNLPATDFSGNGNDLGYPFPYGGGSADITNDALAGAYAVVFANNGGSGGDYYYNSNPNLLSTLAGSFSVSLWLKTAQVSGNDTDSGLTNAGIVSTFNQTVVPMALTGGKLAFVTGSGSPDTLHSATSINTGQYVHVVVTRDQVTGQKKIYVNSALDTSDIAGTGFLSDPRELDIGSGNGHGFNGEMDDIQIYTNVLSAGQVLQLYNNPGTTITNATGGGPEDFGIALNATNLTWVTGGDANWFVETTNTYDGVSAAQSGPITDSQTNWIATTIPANGQVSFYWKVSSGQDFDYLTFYINGVQQDDISGEVDWNQETYSVSAGDTLRWEYGKGDSNSEGQDAGWLDQVQYTTNTVSATPVSVSFDFQIQRYQDLADGYDQYAFYPQITFISPAPSTTNRVESPDGLAYSEVWTGDSSQDDQSGAGFNSLDDLIYACTNGQWKLYINKDDPSERVFHFNVSISGLTTNLLASINVLVPTNRAVNVATNSPLRWVGPANYTSVFVEAYQQFPSFAFDGYTNLPGNSTNWPSPPTLRYGTNYFYVSYASNNFPNVTFTTPVDGSNPVSSWDTEVDVSSDTFISFVVGAPAPLPVQLTASSQPAGGGNFQLSFQSLAGRPETIQFRTNLTVGAWMDVTNFIGDGSVQQFSFPTTNSAAKFFRVMTQ